MLCRFSHNPEITLNHLNLDYPECDLNYSSWQGHFSLWLGLIHFWDHDMLVLIVVQISQTQIYTYLEIYGNSSVARKCDGWENVTLLQPQSKTDLSQRLIDMRQPKKGKSISQLIFKCGSFTRIPHRHQNHQMPSEKNSVKNVLETGNLSFDTL